MSKPARQPGPAGSKASGHVDCLDGLRGIAAFWVVIGHAMKLSGWGFKPFDKPDLAVDLFILLSGFLMAFHYIRRREREPWEAKSTWAFFWLRRFFRIAPLYYIVLAAALLLGPQLGEIRHFLGAVIPGSGTDPARYSDQSVTNAALHVSFLFGFLPQYGYRMAIPDWSIGLEMQFYLAFPFLMLLWDRIGGACAAVLLAAACLALRFVVPELIDAFAMPTFLPLKLPLFLAGMLAAGSLFAEGGRGRTMIAAAAIVAFMPTWRTDGLLDLVARLGLLSMLLVLPATDRLARLPLLASLARLANAILRQPLLRLMGDVSYGVYLIHLLIMIPVIREVITIFGIDVAPPVLFGFTLGLTILFAYPIAYLAHFSVEQWGIRVGRSVVDSAQRMRPVFARRSA